ncbi:hypothetical protein BZG36_04321 [Bifiguratus adelaidae]|uniref:Cytoplasmic tRNA 2-thiolation protein 2 n=1 Tax=Bifiguratus adelaidae TaxID=1938954 RepID=A0A261XV27_9FUNG|nr:hypothetical protein BZG36_04321 [Bifiguratus adelaidae]
MSDVDSGPLRAPKPKAGTCIKCKTRPSTVVLRHVQYCKDCFLFATTGKFRSAFGKSAISNTTGHKAMVAFSGGPSSRALLHLMKGFQHVGSHQSGQKRLFDELVICHIDETAAFNGSSTLDMARVVVDTEYPDFTFHGQLIEDIYEDEALSSIDKKEKLRQLFAQAGSLTAKEDLLWHIKMHLLVKAAQKLGCTRLILGDSATRIAIKVISFTAKGRGYSLPLEIGGDIHGLYPNLVILRPLKDMLAKEIAIYDHSQGLLNSLVPATNFSTMAPPTASIDRATEEFIVGLDRDFPSTVSTIVRTASKLKLASSMNGQSRCALCHMPIQSGSKDWKQRITVQSTQCTRDSAPGTLTVPENILCYACQTDLSESEGWSRLADDASPSTQLEEFRSLGYPTLLTQDDMHQRIKDFLLDD